MFCIDQENTTERNSQVEIMHLIYKYALRTIVFLGCNRAPTLEFKLSPRRLHREIRKAHVEGEGRVLKEFRLLFSHPWFQRVWVLQEIGVSKMRKVIFLYRVCVLTWRTVSKAAFFLGTYLPGHKYDLSLPPSAIQHNVIMSAWTAMGPGSSQFYVLNRYGRLHLRYQNWASSIFLIAMEPRLIELLQDSRFCLATDPRDKVYSLLNMLQIDPTKDEFAHHLTVDYSLPVTEVYVRAARYSIETENSLEVLCYKEGVSNIPDLPSWVPDWTQQMLFPIHRIPNPAHFRSQFHLKAWPITNLPPLHRTRNKTSIATFSTYGKMLTLTGHKLDTITTLSSIWPSAIDVPNLTLFHE